MDSVTVTVIIVISTIIIIQAVNILIKMPCCNNSHGLTAVMILNNNDDVEMKLENVIHKIRWTDDELIKKIIIVNNGMNCEQYEICKIYCCENEILEMAECDEVLKLIFSSEK